MKFRLLTTVNTTILSAGMLITAIIQKNTIEYHGVSQLDLIYQETIESYMTHT